MSDANVWVAITAGIALLIQFLTGAYFYGGLSQTVKSMKAANEEWRKDVREEFKQLKDEISHLREKLYFR